MNTNYNMDLIHILVFGAIIVGVLTYSYIVFVAPINEAHIKLLQKYHPEWFIKPTDNTSNVPQTTIVFNGTAPVDWVKPKGISDINYTVISGGL
jgi:hypothetical protein